MLTLTIESLELCVSNNYLQRVSVVYSVLIFINGFFISLINCLCYTFTSYTTKYKDDS